MTVRHFLQNIVMIAAIAVVWCGSYFVTPDNVETMQSVLLKVMGAAIVLRTLLTIGDDVSGAAFFGFLIAGVVLFGLGFVGDAFGVNDLIFPIAVPIATGLLGLYQFFYNRLVIHASCDLPTGIWVLGWAYPVVMMAGAVLSFFHSLIALILISVSLVGALGYSLYCIIQFSQTGRRPRRSPGGRTPGGRSSSTPSRKNNSPSASASEKEVVSRVERIARNYSKTVDLGYGASVQFSVRGKVYFGNIEYTVSAKKSGSGISDEYGLQRAYAALQSQTERLVNDIMDSTEQSLSEIDLPRDYNMNVKLN